MTVNSSPEFQQTVNEANQWVQSLMTEMSWDDPRLASKALLATLHVLRDRLSPDRVVGLGTQLTALIRGLYYEEWNIAKAPVRLRDREIFFRGVMEKLNGKKVTEEVDVEALTRAVFHLLNHRVSQTELKKIQSELPSRIRDLWPRERNTPHGTSH